MLIEFTLLLTWFNPFSWLISRMIKENHEHLADRQVLTAGINPARYRAQLLNHIMGVNVFRLGNQFNHSVTFKRFNMMKKPRKSPAGIVKIALLFPVILITLGLATGMTSQQKVINGKVIFADTGKPPLGASVIIEGTTVGTITDAEGKFMLEVDGNPNIVISFVGYSTKRIKSSAIKKKPLKLEPKVYELDLESVPFAAKTVDENIKKDFEDVRHKGDEVFYIVEDMPMFPGGKSALKKYIYSNLKYPESAAKKGISGEVYVQFLVTTSGKLEDIKVAQSNYKAFNKPALDLFKDMPYWNPGKQRGKPVQVQVVVPVRFNADVE
jgi:TonB family protein